MGKQGIYSEELAGKLIRKCLDDLSTLYLPGAFEWARLTRSDLSDAVMTAFKAIDLPCDASNIQGLHAALASFRSASADLVAGFRRVQMRSRNGSSGPRPPSPEEIIPKVQMVPEGDFGAQKLLFGSQSGTGPLGHLGA